MTKRRDSKGRILKEGESQRSDGRYEYKYTDRNGKRHSYYSWQLVATDPLPAGKQEKEPLRVFEQHLTEDVVFGVDTYDASTITVNDMFDTYMALKSDLRQTTLNTYRSIYTTHIKPTFGNTPIASIRYSQVKKFYLDLLKEKKIGMVQQISAVFFQLFSIAVRDDICRKNPAAGVMREIKAGGRYPKQTREALTVAQQESLVDFVKNSPRYHKNTDLITFLLCTGLRINEAAALRWEDINFDEKYFSVNHSLSYCRNSNGEYRYVMGPPKTEAGHRIIPMVSGVYEILMRQKLKQAQSGICKVVVDGLSGFVFMNCKGGLLMNSSFDTTLKNISKAHNARQLSVSVLEPVLLPDNLSAHIFRHSFCTRLCEAGVNPHVVQKVMGHTDLRTTLAIYDSVSTKRTMDGIQEVAEKLSVAK